MLTLACAVATAACSTSPSSGDAGQPLPDAFIAATFGPATGSTGCSFGSVEPWLDVGVPAQHGKPATVSNGGTQDGAPVQLSCTVAPSGGGFDVSLSIATTGSQGSSVTITSPAGQGVVTLAGGQGLDAVFRSAASGTYEASGCTLAFTYEGEDVPVSPPIAAGRVWGHLSCPSAAQEGGLSPCDAEADLLFEECTP